MFIGACELILDFEAEFEFRSERSLDIFYLKEMKKG